MDGSAETKEWHEHAHHSHRSEVTPDRCGFFFVRSIRSGAYIKPELSQVTRKIVLHFACSQNGRPTAWQQPFVLIRRQRAMYGTLRVMHVGIDKKSASFRPGLPVWLPLHESTTKGMQ